VNQADIPGYTYGTGAVPRSPVSLDELELLEATLLLGPDDLAALRRSADLLAPRVEEILDVWYGFVGANPHLLAAFTGPDGQPDTDYLAAVRRRFGRWILDTAAADHDQAWLDTSTRSACATTARARTAPTAPGRPTTSPCATWSPCSSRSRRRSSRSCPATGWAARRSRPCTRRGSRRSCSS
jgi:Protoglobin